MSKLNVVVLYDRWDEPEVESASAEKAPLTRTLDKKEVEDEVAESGPRDLQTILDTRPIAFLKNDAYAWSWAVCEFLDSHPRYRDRFRNVGRQMAVKTLQADLAKVFGDDWNDLREEWLLFAANLCHGYDTQRAAIEFRTGKPLTANDAPHVVEIAADGEDDSAATLSGLSTAARNALASVRSQTPAGPFGTGGATPTGPSLQFFSDYAPLQDPLRLELESRHQPQRRPAVLRPADILTPAPGAGAVRRLHRRARVPGRPALLPRRRAGLLGLPADGHLDDHRLPTRRRLVPHLP